MLGTLKSIQVGMPREPITGSIAVHELGLTGDGVGNTWWCE